MLCIDDVRDFWKQQHRMKEDFSDPTSVSAVDGKRTEPDSVVLLPLSLYSLFDGSFSGTMKTTLPTLDPIH